MSTDFQLAPTKDTNPTPLDTEPTEQVTVPAPTPPTTTKTAPARELDHTPGGLPVIPLAVITSNTAVASLSAVAVTAGPAAAAATAGSLLLSAVAVKAAGRRQTRRPAPRPSPQKPKPKTVKQQTSATRQVPASGRRTAPPSQRTAPGSSGSRPAPRRTTTSPSAGTTTTRKPATTPRSSTAGGTSQAKQKPPRNGPGQKKPAPRPTSRAGQIKALRKEKTSAAPTRRERRAKDTADRRNLRDGRRQAKRDDRAQKKTPKTPSSRGTGTNTGPKSPSQTGRGLGTAKGTSTALRKQTTPAATVKTTGKAADTLRPVTTTDKARGKLRNAIDNAHASRAARIQQARKKAKARATLAKNRTHAKARYGLQAAARALLAAPIGLIGCLTTPLGKRLGWAWLQYPGRRLYRRLTATARHNRDARLADADNTYAHDTNPAALDATDQQPLADTVARAPRNGHSPEPSGDTDMSEDIKLHFLETSEETVSAARAYEPGGMLHVRQVVKAMPVALENWAMAFAVLAEKSDAEFPLGDEIGEGLDDIHQQMRALISRAEDLADTFDRIHESDIERLLNPRKSRDAEKTWDTAANEDYDGE